MAKESMRKWLDRLRERRQARRERTVERQRHRSEHQREQERAGKVGSTDPRSGEISGGAG
jgi:hypothetical protein